MSGILNKIYEKKEKERIWKEFIGFIHDFDEKNIYVRHEYKAPEIDELDKISKENILSWKINIGEKIKYFIST
jgi:hypothetical protein